MNLLLPIITTPSLNITLLYPWSFRHNPTGPNPTSTLTKGVSKSYNDGGRRVLILSWGFIPLLNWNGVKWTKIRKTLREKSSNVTPLLRCMIFRRRKWFSCSVKDIYLNKPFIHINLLLYIQIQYI